MSTNGKEPAWQGIGRNLGRGNYVEEITACHLLNIPQVRRAALISLRDKSKGGIFVLSGLICCFKVGRRFFRMLSREVVA